MPYFAYQNRRVYFEETGRGDPVLLLHGNTASGRMFAPILELYGGYRLVLVDFLGHGRSDRLAQFPEDFWFDEGMQVVRLIEAAGYGRAHLVGTSGGALAALNAALERPDLVRGVVADSFPGETLTPAAVARILQGREEGAEAAAEFWRYCHGADWLQVAQNDTGLFARHRGGTFSFFHRPMEELQPPALFAASREDELILDAPAVAEAFAQRAQNGRFHVFDSGAHPAMLSNAAAFARLAGRFLAQA